MAILKVQSFKEKQTSTGKTKYIVSGLLDGAPEVVTMWERPEDGKEYEGYAKESEYGINFNLPRKGQGSGGYRGKDPTERMEICRENAATNATNLAIARAGILERQGKIEEAFEQLKPTKVALSAYWIAKFNAGKWVPDMAQPEDQEEPASKTEDVRLPWEKDEEEG